MSEPVQSTKYPDYFRIPDLALGLTVVPWRSAVKRVWGKRHMIEFLINLGQWWDFGHNPYKNVAFAPILLGDISPEGGAHPKRDPVSDHSSHKTGVDVDIYVFRKDGKPERTAYFKKDEYDLERTTELAKLIFYVAGRYNIGIDYVWYNDKDVRQAVPGIATWPNHEDHFHIRLK